MVVSATYVIIGFMLDTDVWIPLPCNKVKVRWEKLSDNRIEIKKKKSNFSQESFKLLKL